MDNSGQDLRKYALRIYTIIKNGPLDKSGANELTDFIIPPDEVFSNQVTFEDWVKTHSNQEIILSLYSLLTKKFRDIKIKTNPLGSKEGILGASVQKENWTLANKKVLHIISVKENSFAQKELGLIPNEDYIVGVKCKSSRIIPLNNDDFSPLEILSKVVRENKGNSVKFYIYNKEKGSRDVTAKIGNDYYFSLGCDGAFGALHMFPSLEKENNNINSVKNSEIKDTSEEKKDNIINNEIKKQKENKEIENIKNNEDINNNNKVNMDKKNNINLNANNKEKEENNLIEKKEISQGQENNLVIQKETQDEKKVINIDIKEDNNEKQKQIEADDKTQSNNNIDSKPSDNNINKIAEEMSVEKDLEVNHSPKKEEKVELIEEKNTPNNIENKDEEVIQESKEEINQNKNFELKQEANKEIKDINNIAIKKEDKNEEAKVEIKKENLLSNIITYKEENQSNKEEVKQDDKKEDSNNDQKNQEEKDNKEVSKIEEIKKEEIEEDKTEEKEEENKEENKDNNNNANNTNNSSSNKNKRRKKRNKH